MEKNIFERFGVKDITDLTKVNLIGIDFGDGEFCGTWVYIDIHNKLKLESLDVEKTLSRKKDMTAIFIPQDKNGEITIGQEALNDSISGRKGVLYHNFKRRLGPASKERYKNGDVGVPSYESLMQMCFNQIINKFYKNNRNCFLKDRTVILVGRPASEGWRASELEYAKLLKNGLKIQTYTGMVDIIIVSESLAALAYETMPEVNSVKKGDRVAIFDGGSSTFDLTLILGDHIPENGEYSRQFGAGLIEKCMLQQFFSEGHSRENLTNEYDEMLLRGRKENYFGTKGDNGIKIDSYTVEFDDATEASSRINDKFMTKAINETKIQVGSSSLAIPEKNYNSWYEACVDFFVESKIQIGQCCRGSSRLNKIILTGGATVMPFVSEIVEKTFGIKPTRAESPNYTVANGLAYMGAVEILKIKELSEIEKLVDGIIDNAPSVERAVAQYMMEIAWEKIDTSLQRWKNTSVNGSIDGWFKSLKEDYDGLIGGKVYESTKKWYEDNINGEVKKVVRDRFNKLFPNFKNEYTFIINEEFVYKSMNEQNDISVIIDYSTLFGGWFLFWNGSGDVLNSTKRDKCYWRVMEKKEEIKSNMKSQFYTQLKIEKAVKDNLKEALKLSIPEYVDNMTIYFIRTGKA